MKYAVFVSQDWGTDWGDIRPVSVLETDGHPKDIIDRYRLISGLAITGVVPIAEGSTVYAELGESDEMKAVAPEDLPRFEDCYAPFLDAPVRRNTVDPLKW